MNEYKVASWPYDYKNKRYGKKDTDMDGRAKC